MHKGLLIAPLRAGDPFGFWYLGLHLSCRPGCIEKEHDRQAVNTLERRSLSRPGYSESSKIGKKIALNAPLLFCRFLV
jgi:hypothetical protein